MFKEVNKDQVMVWVRSASHLHFRPPGGGGGGVSMELRTKQAQIEGVK